MAENKIDSLANGSCPSTESTTIDNELESPGVAEEQTVGKTTEDINTVKKVIEESPMIESAEKCDKKEEGPISPTPNKPTATGSPTRSRSEREDEPEIEERREPIKDKVEKGDRGVSPDRTIEINDAATVSDKTIAENSPAEDESGKPSPPEILMGIETKEVIEDEEVEAKPEEDESPVIIEEVITEDRDKRVTAVGGDRSIREMANHQDEAKNENDDDHIEGEEVEDDEEEMEHEEPEVVEDEEEEEDEEEDDDDDDENENEQLEVGIVGPPTAVSELINEEELRCSESVLLTEGRRRGVDSVQDHVAEWVQNSAKIEDLTIDEDENENESDNRHDIDETEESDVVLRTDQQTLQMNAENHEKTGEVLATRKSKRVVSNIIKRSIKCLNKIHAMDVSSGVKGSEKGATKKVDKISERNDAVPPAVPKEQRGGVPAEGETESELAGRNHRGDRRNHNNHSNHRRNGGGDGPEDGGRQPSYGVKKEPNSEPESDTETERDVLPELRKRAGSDRAKNIKAEIRENKKRRSTDEIQNSNGSSKRACLGQREEFISSIVGGEKVTTEELTVRADQLRAELQALDQLARAKEKEWNEILSMRKLKEEAYLRIERRRQVVGFMEGNSQLNETSVLPQANLSLEPEWDNTKEKSNSTEATLSDKSITRPQVTSKQQNENGQKESSDGQNSENRQIGEGRQGPMVDVRTIIADYRLRHPETVPRRSRRMRNSVNVGLGAGGAVVETTHIGADSRPSSTDSCKSSSNATDPSNSMSFKDVLVQFAKLSQQQGEAVKTPQNYPDVTLHPVLPSPAMPQTAAIQQSGSLLHGILTKSQSPRPTTFSPTLARLLTAPERDRCNPIATSTPQQAAATQHLLQAYQGTNPVSISDLLSSSKARTEITITPVVSTPTPQSHSNSLIHVEDVEEETTVIEERGRSSNARDDSPPRCQGCQDRAAQFVCAGCGNQWYCSRECQVSAWDEHSEVCSG